MTTIRDTSATTRTVLVLGATGKTGRRVLNRLQGQPDKRLRLRAGSRSAARPFDWHDRSGWPAALEGVDAVYLSYVPDLSLSRAPSDVAAFSHAAVEAGVRRVVMLSGRGEPTAQACERIVQESAAEWTVLRCSWFMQNFSESFLLDPILDGTVALPVTDAVEPFVDLEDVADIAAQALTTDDHLGQTYELSGPQSITFADAVAEIARATGRMINFVPVSLDGYLSQLAEYGLPDDLVGLFGYLFGEVLDGRNSAISDGVQRALGRNAGSFNEFAARTAAAKAWDGR